MDGFLFSIGSLVTIRFLLTIGSLWYGGFLDGFGSLVAIGFLSTIGSLTHPGFLLDI